MRQKLITAVAVLASVWAVATQAADFSGRYHGSVANLPTALVLEQDGATLHGKMLSDGDSPYAISGTVKGSVARGEMVYERTGLKLSFEARMRGAALTWTPTVFGMPLGNAASQFQRNDAAAQSAPREEAREEVAVAAVGTLDRRLIGAWASEYSYASGDFSAVGETRATLRGDGTYTFGASQLAGGGNSGAFNSGKGGETARGRWTTQDGVLYVMEAGARNWDAYGRYGFTSDGSTVRIVFGDGSKHYWNRR